MTSHKIAIKLFATDDSIPGHAFVPVFHRWIQQHALADHMLIDVADYAHVANGPGTVLVSHEANLYADRDAGRLGLLYTRKQPAPGPFADRLRSAAINALKVAALLESDADFAGRLIFRTDEISVRVNDRLLAPNTPETFAALTNDVQGLADTLFPGAGATIEQDANPLGVFAVTIRAATNARVTDLLERTGDLAAA